MPPTATKVDMGEKKRIPLERERAHKEWMNSHWKSISERACKFNASKFWVKL